MRCLCHYFRHVTIFLCGRLLVRLVKLSILPEIQKHSAPVRNEIQIQQGNRKRKAEVKIIKKNPTTTNPAEHNHMKGNVEFREFLIFRELILYLRKIKYKNMRITYQFGTKSGIFILV